MRVELRVEARHDLTEAASFYEFQRQGLGDEFIESIFADLETLEFQAGIHPRVFHLHRKLASRFPFAFYYKVSGEFVDVVAVLDCRQNPATTTRRLSQIPP